ncbi:MAG: hypothetical protein KatS3mg060_2285 [Dehalococcoidia bacterium]|nr:MAG: hypothetical protein KatS3mg060_2285 [Dehalococcoidia bacterium]
MLKGGGVHTSSQAGAVWLPFVAAAVAFALVGGFGLGGALFLAIALGLPLGAWWAAAGHAHGHAQLFGWAGLMVFGVGFHFLPRLRGRPLAHPEHARTVLALMAGGLVLRVITQPWQAQTPHPLLGAALVLSGLLELAGATVGLGLFALTLRGDPPVRSRTGFASVLPLFAAAGGALWHALAANVVAVAALAAGAAGQAVAAGHYATLVGIYGFLVAISVGMGARLFPLHFGTPTPHIGLLRIGLGWLIAGLVLRLGGDLAGLTAATALGLASMAAALGAFTIGLRVFAPRRAVPGERRPWHADAAQWHGLSAFAWLVVDAALLGLGAAAWAWPELGRTALAAEAHVVGAGFVTLLILGEGVNLLPGFARRPLRSGALVWATLALGNLAAALRTGPLLLPPLFPAGSAAVALAASGLAGLLAVGLFALNLGGPRRPARSRPPA